MVAECQVNAVGVCEYAAQKEIVGTVDMCWEVRHGRPACSDCPRYNVCGDCLPHLHPKERATFAPATTA